MATLLIAGRAHRRPRRLRLRRANKEHRTRANSSRSTSCITVIDEPGVNDTRRRVIAVLAELETRAQLHAK